MWVVIDGEITNEDVPSMVTCLCEPYPKCVYHKCVAHGDWINDIIPEMEEPFSSDPIPYTLWYIDQYSNIGSGLVPDMVSIFEEPYPASLFIYDNGDIGASLIPPMEPIGAFANTPLTNIEFPYETVTFGENAFKNTPNLQTVEISILSEYNEHKTFDNHTIVKYKPINYFKSTKLENTSEYNDRMLFGDTQTNLDHYYTSDGAKTRIRIPINVNT